MPDKPPADPNLFDGDWAAGKPTVTPAPKPGKPAPAPVKLDQFKKIIADHNAARGLLGAMRSGFIKAMDKTKMLDALDRLYDCADGDGLDNAQAIRDRLSSDAAKGDGGAFDPWNGWWAGEFSSWNGKKADVFYPLHVWDPTIDIGEGANRQCVQMVAQTNADKKKGKNWFPGPTRLKKAPKAHRKTDFAINVWSGADHLTGWVSKDGGKTVMPHVAYLLDAQTLLWVSFLFTPAAATAEGACRYAGTWTGLFFIERVSGLIDPAKVDAPDRRGKRGALKKVYTRYVIRGALCAVKIGCKIVDGAAVYTVRFSKPRDICKHFGDYRRFPRVSRTKKLRRYADDPAATPLSGARPGRIGRTLRKAGH